VPRVQGEDEVSHQVQFPIRRIRGVGVLRYPEGHGEKARQMMGFVQDGSVLCLPDARDSYGNYLWDFRIEGTPDDEVDTPVVVEGPDGQPEG
jgi:hypothetical protein